MNFYDILQYAPEEILVYLRKSRSDDPSLTVEEVLKRHEGMLKEWVERNLPRPIPEENFFREIVSGEQLENRPEMQKVLKLIESPKYKAILVVEAQRLSRGDLEDCGKLIKLLRYTDTKVITLQKTYDLSDEYDRDAFERELKRGNEFLEYTKKILNRGRMESVKSGNYLGSVAPYGYKKIIVMDGKKKCPTLEPDENEAPVVRMIFDMFGNQGLTIDKITTKLNRMGIVPRNGKTFSRTTVRDVLENPHYIGKVRWNWRQTTHIVQDSEVIAKRLTNADYLLFDGKHEALISEELFNRCQERIGNTPKVNPFTELKNPLASMMYCKKCGTAITIAYDSRKNMRYRCRHFKQCRTGSVSARMVIDAVCDELEKQIEDFEVRLNEGVADEQKRREKEVRMLEKKIKELEAKEISLWEKYAEDNMPKDIFDKLREKTISEKEIVTSELKAAKENTKVSIDYEERIATFSEALEALRDDNVSAEQQNNLLRACIEKINYFRESPVKVQNGENTVKGWVQTEFGLEIELRI